MTVPTDYSTDLVEALRQPYAVAIDETALKRLGVKLGDQALYNSKTVRVAAVTRGYPNMMQATIVMSRDTLRMVGQADTGPRVGPLMIKLRDPSTADVVAAELNATGAGQWKAWTRQQLADAGVAMVIYPVTLLRSAMGAAERVLDAIKEEGTQQSQVEQMLTRARLYELVDYEGYNAFDTGIFNFDVPTLDIGANHADL